MKKSPYIPFAFLCLLSATSCIEEKLDPCPPQGGSVTVALRVEKFQARPSYRPSDFEQEFGKRIHSLDYLLYAGGQLVGQGRADDLHTASGGDYLFRIDTLPFGTYRLAFVANVTPRMMTGTMDAPEARYIVYQGEKNGDDHFRADVPFEVTCPCRNEFEAVLQRVHGITRFRFENIPARIASVEVVLDNVGQRMPLCGEPDLACEVSKPRSAAEDTPRRVVHARHVLHAAGRKDIVAAQTLRRGRRTALRPGSHRHPADRMQPVDRPYGTFRRGRFPGRNRVLGRRRHDMGRSQRRRGRNHTMTRSMFPARPSRAAGALCLPWKRHGRTPADGRERNSGARRSCGGFYFNRQPFSSSILPGTSASFIRRIRATSCMESISSPIVRR